MAKTVSIVVPTYRRPDNLRSTFRQLEGHKVWFVCHESDTESQGLVKGLGAELIIDVQPPSGVNATNAGYWYSDGDLVVIGQDDFWWHKNWLEESLDVMEKTGAKVVGYNDGFAGRPEYSVGWLVDRKYVEDNSLSIGFPNVIFNPHYKKNFSDTELNDTAKARGVWAYAHKALLEHLHPTFQKAPNDKTYSELERHLTQDMELYNSRKHLWVG